MSSQILIVIPTDRALARHALDPLLGVPLFLRNGLTVLMNGHDHLMLAAPPYMHPLLRTLWTRCVGAKGQLTLVSLDAEHRVAPEHRFTLRAAMAERCAVLHALTVVTEAWVREGLNPALRHGHRLHGAIVMHRAQLHEQLDSALQTVMEGPTPPAMHRHYLHVTTATHRRAVETLLSKQIRQGDIGWFAKQINKRLSLPISRVLARWRLSPHLITIVNMAIGLGAGIAAMGETYAQLLLAGVLFQLASIVDGCDGEVAKFTFRTSRFGQVLDTVGDTLTLLCFFVGLGLHAPFGIVALLFGGVGTLLGIMLLYLARHGDSWSLVAFDRLFVRPRVAAQRGALPWLLHYGKLAIKKDCFSWVFCGLALVGALPFALYLGAFAAWAAVAGILWMAIVPVSSLPHQTAADSTDQILRHH